MDIFAKDNIGCHISCRLEKDGDRTVDYVKWTHAMVGAVVNRKVLALTPMKSGERLLVKEISKGWTVVEVGV